MEFDQMYTEEVGGIEIDNQKYNSRDSAVSIEGEEGKIRKVKAEIYTD